MEKKSEIPLCWNVFRYNDNSKDLDLFNIFSHVSFKNGVIEILSRNLSRKSFDVVLEQELRYYFWKRAEYELWMRELFGQDDTKVDIYTQVMSNFKQFADYVWNTYEALKSVESG